MRRISWPILALVPLAGLAAGAFALAQDAPPDGRPVGAYAGVVPGTGNLPPRAPRPGEGARLMTWPGFQARPDGASRFFVQTNQSVTHRLVREQGRTVVILEGTGIHLRNNRRPLETRFFNTPVDRAWVERRGADVAFVLAMRSDVTPGVTSEPAENGYHYVFVEFPPGDFVPAELRTETVAPSDGTTQDDERPPDLR